MQNKLDLICSYCSHWSLEVNVDKRKGMVFRKRGRLTNDKVWTYGGNTIDDVDDFNYLGTVFHYTGNFSRNTEHIVGKSLTALKHLLYKSKSIPLKPKALLQLLDSFVSSILCNGSEICGNCLKFCKRILNVEMNSCNAAVYGELGRYPMFVPRYVRTIKYRCKLLNT